MEESSAAIKDDAASRSLTSNNRVGQRVYLLTSQQSFGPLIITEALSNDQLAVQFEHCRALGGIIAKKYVLSAHNVLQTPPSKPPTKSLGDELEQLMESVLEGIQQANNQQSELAKVIKARPTDDGTQGGT